MNTNPALHEHLDLEIFASPLLSVTSICTLWGSSFSFSFGFDDNGLLRYSQTLIVDTRTHREHNFLGKILSFIADLFLSAIFKMIVYYKIGEFWQAS